MKKWVCPKCQEDRYRLASNFGRGLSFGAYYCVNCKLYFTFSVIGEPEKVGVSSV